MLSLPLFLLIGISLGLLGGGGSIIAVPILVYVSLVDAHRAVPMSLAIIGATSAGAAWQHWRDGNVHLRGAALFGAASLVGAWVGARFTHAVSQRTLLLAFSAVTIVVALRMLTSGPPSEGAGKSHPLSVLAVGAAVGVLTGFLGVGGGFLIVPALLFLLRLPMKQAVGTSLVIIAITAVGGLASHLQQTSIDWPQTLLFTLIALAGTVIGLALVRRVNAQRLRQGFGVFVLLIGLTIGYLNL